MFFLCHFNLFNYRVSNDFYSLLCTPMEVGEVMTSCEAWLLKSKIIEKPFTAAQIADGALQDHLTQEDYDALLKVNFIVSHL